MADEYLLFLAQGYGLHSQKVKSDRQEEFQECQDDIIKRQKGMPVGMLMF